MNDISNSYNIPSEYDNNSTSNITVNDEISIIESSNLNQSNDTPQGWENSSGPSAPTLQFMEWGNLKR